MMLMGVGVGWLQVRAYSTGELATCRRLLEAGLELRVPVPKINKQVFAFWEHGSDLGCSKAVSCPPFSPPPPPAGPPHSFPHDIF